MSWQFDRCGDHLALDFANTVSERGTDSPIERIPDYPALVAFARQTGLVSAPRAAGLLDAARGAPAAAARVHRSALTLRDALYELFAAVARNQPPDSPDLATLNAELGRLCVGDHLALTWRHDPESLDGFLGAIVHGAVLLATVETERARVRICEAADCEWLFHDGSRNRSRRWCDMALCGNRQKARRHYARVAGRDSGGTRSGGTRSGGTRRKRKG